MKKYTIKPVLWERVSTFYKHDGKSLCRAIFKAKVLNDEYKIYVTYIKIDKGISYRFAVYFCYNGAYTYTKYFYTAKEAKKAVNDSVVARLEFYLDCVE